MRFMGDTSVYDFSFVKQFSQIRSTMSNVSAERYITPHPFCEEMEWAELHRHLFERY